MFRAVDRHLEPYESPVLHIDLALHFYIQLGASLDTGTRTDTLTAPGGALASSAGSTASIWAVGRYAGPIEF
jgi:hypothetical protein